MAGTAKQRTPRRRTQAERRETTRARLLDATLGCLRERGYAGTTTAEIESRAGVSRGARLHHFPSKADLLSASVGHLYDDIARRYAKAMAADVPEGDRFHRGFRLLWDVYDDSSYDAVLELLVAARTDAELRQALLDSSPGHHRDVRRRANAYFPDLATREADGLLEALQAVMTGLAVRRALVEDPRADDRVLDVVERMVEATFAGSASLPRATKPPPRSEKPS
jgi:AcrR family transcriptional regulator